MSDTRIENLPACIYAFWEGEEKDEDRFLNTTHDADGVAETNTKKRFGVYEFKGLVDICREVTVSITPAKKGKS